MRILITGATGLVGSALSKYLISKGHEVIPLVRTESPDGRQPWWDPANSRIDLEPAGHLDAVVHLAGENISSGRWTQARMQLIRDSRVNGTELLCEAIAGLKQVPNTLVCASAIGFYGDRGDETVNEQSGPGTGFLPELCQEWEAATEAASDVGIRVVSLRTGIVLSPKGGALAKMLTPFKLCLGGVIGSGTQLMSWIDLDDLVAAFDFCLNNDDICGPVNGTAPNPVTNREFTKTLGSVISRPTIFPMPAFVARLAFGKMGEDLLLRGQKIVPDVLMQAGFKFGYPTLKESLHHQLG